MNDTTITVTMSQLTAAFSEWERRFRADPASFSLPDDVHNQTPEERGASSADYLAGILREHKVAKV